MTTPGRRTFSLIPRGGDLPTVAGVVIGAILLALNVALLVVALTAS